MGVNLRLRNAAHFVLYLFSFFLFSTFFVFLHGGKLSSETAEGTFPPPFCVGGGCLRLEMSELANCPDTFRLHIVRTTHIFWTRVFPRRVQNGAFQSRVP